DGGAPPAEANILPGFSNAAEIALRMPRKDLRFDIGANGISLRSLLYNRGDAVDFYKRFAREARNCDCRARRTSVWEICFEDGIHSLVVIELGEIDGQLKDAVHRSTTGFDKGFHAIHDHFCVHFDRRRLSGIRFVASRMRTLSSDVDQPVVENQGSDKSLGIGWLAIAVQL